MYWRRVWLVTAVSDDKEARREKTTATVAELRHLLETARANPAVWHVSFESRRELVGDMPATCPNGHNISTRGTMAAPHDWWDCPCGGHWWIQCRACGRERVDPPLAYDCRPRTPGH